jgi:hypothetical protein
LSGARAADALEFVGVIAGCGIAHHAFRLATLQTKDATMATADTIWLIK